MLAELPMYIATLFVGALGGFLFKEFFQGLFKDSIKKHGSSAALILRKKFGKTPQTGPETFFFGDIRTNLLVVDGDGDLCYKEDSLDLIYQGGSPLAPDDIQDRITAQQREFESAHEKGEKTFWDGVGVGLNSYTVLRPKDENYLELRANLYTSRYADFLATVATIGREDRSKPSSIWQSHIKDWDHAEPIPYLARHVGVVCLCITSDQFAIFAQRHRGSGARANEYDVSVVEGIEPTKDCFDVGTLNKIDLFQTVQRGCFEELGFRPKKSEIEVLGFALDLDYYQYNFVALVKSSLSFEAIRNNRPGNASGLWELKSLRSVKFAPEEMVEFVKANQMWSFAKLAVYWSLLRNFHKGHVKSVIASEFIQKAEIVTD